MNTSVTVSKQGHWLAGVVATVATLMVVGGSLSLAEHYAESGMTTQAASTSLARQATSAVTRHS